MGFVFKCNTDHEKKEVKHLLFTLKEQMSQLLSPAAGGLNLKSLVDSEAGGYLDLL